MFNRLCRAREMLSGSGTEPPTVVQVAQAIGVSSFHFIRASQRLGLAISEKHRRAAKFYTQVLGFTKIHDIPVGDYRRLTVVSPEGPDDLELALEPNANPASRAFQEAMFSQGIPIAAFEVADLAAEYARLTKHGVAFTREPPPAGAVRIAVSRGTYLFPTDPDGSRYDPRTARLCGKQVRPPYRGSSFAAQRPLLKSVNRMWPFHGMAFITNGAFAV